MAGWLEKSRVLVVEDSRAINGMICASLGELPGVACESASSLAEAQGLLKVDPERFCLAVLDLNLPDGPNGEIVDLVQGAGVPSVVLTGMVDDTLRKSMFDKGVIDYEVKQQGSGIERVVALVARLKYFRDRSIMVVDDSASFRGYVAALLQQHGYRTIEAANGEEALSLLQEHSEVCLMVVDYNMPGMGGVDLVRAVRKLRGRDELPVIGISGGSKDSATIAFLKSGANDFISKPFEVEEFYLRVDQNLDVMRYIHDVREAANRDYLTKLYNRRYFFATGEPMYAGAVRGHQKIAAAVMDLDHFKQVNDTYGHDAGDLVLVEVAKALQGAIRQTDLLARFGGEEFIVLFSLKEMSEAEWASERIRKAIEDLQISFDGHAIPVTASIGVTTDLSDSLKGMLQKADEGVYAAKEGGRNRVVLITPGTEPANTGGAVGA